MTKVLFQWIYDPVVGKIIAALIGYFLIVIVIFLIKTSVNKYVEDRNVRYRTKKVFVYIGYFVAIIFTMAVFSEQLGGLTVVLGVAGVGVAFALQEVIMSLAGWVAISLGKFFSPGDRVQLGGTTGDVVDIGILRTTLMETGRWVDADLYNGRVVRIANSFVFKEPVFNYSGTFPFLWDEIKMPIKYGSDYKLARSILQTVADNATLQYVEGAKKAWSKTIELFVVKEETLEPQVTLTANDNWVEFTIRYVVDYRRRRRTKDILFTNILDQIEQSAGRVQIASTTIQIEPPGIQIQQSSPEYPNRQVGKT